MSVLRKARESVLANSAFARIFQKKTERSVEEPRIADFEQGISDRSADWLSDQWTTNVDSNVAFSMNLLELAMLELREQRVAFFVTGVPYYHQYTGRWSARPHQILANTVRAKGGLFLNSYDVLMSKIKGSRVEDYYWSNDPTHFNENGNQIWAEAQLKFLLDRDNKLLPFSTN